MLRFKHMEKDTFEVQFDLPEVTDTTPVKPRIHTIDDSVCLSCEG